MTKLLVRPPAASRRARAARPRLSARNLGYLGLGWALAYIPVHVYWALGGLSTPIGITGHQPGFRAANWGACVVIAGAALTCLTLTQRWGAALPACGAGRPGWAACSASHTGRCTRRTARCGWRARSAIRAMAT